MYVNVIVYIHIHAQKARHALHADKMDVNVYFLGMYINVQKVECVYMCKNVLNARNV